MKRCSFSPKKTYLLTFLITLAGFVFADEAKWTVAAQKFSITNKTLSSDSVINSAAEMFPARIVENLSSATLRTIQPDEEFDRVNYKLKNERISLFLQLSAAVQVRDAVFLENLSESKLKSKIKAEEKKIADIQKKIDANLEELKKETEKSKNRQITADYKREKTEGQKYVQLFKNLFFTNPGLPQNEKVVIYEKGENNLYTPSESAMADGYTSRKFEKEIVGANIQSLITGKITTIGDYISITTELFTYPGAKSRGTITEIGTLEDADFICETIARQLSPMISASMPVALKVTLEPEEALNSIKFSIDDVVYTKINKEYIIDSGPHQIQFASEGFRTCSTSYFFDGNRIYEINVKLQEITDGKMLVNVKSPSLKNPETELKLYANNEMSGILAPQNPTGEISINGQPVLGQITFPDDSYAFFYIKEKLAKDENAVSVKAKSFDRSDYIEKRRKWLYGSYSALVVSLLPLMYTYGNYNNLSQAYLDGRYTDIQDSYNEALKWQLPSQICTGITIGCAGFFTYELVRYLVAANSVLPSNAKKVNVDSIPLPAVKVDLQNPEVAEDMESQDENAENAEITETGKNTQIVKIQNGKNDGNAKNAENTENSGE